MKKLLSCILSFLPLISYGIFMVIYISNFVDIIMENELSRTTTIIFLVSGILCAISTFGVMFWFIYKTYKNPTLIGGSKAGWIILLYCFNIFVFPVYWFIFIRKELNQK